MVSSRLSPQTKQEAAAGLSTVRPCSATGQVRDVGISGQHLRNILLRLNSSDHDQTVTTLCHGLGDCVGSLGFALSANDVGLPLLLGLLDDESRALGLLLGDLLLLDGLGELLAEGHVCNRDVLEGNIELIGALQEVGADFVGDSLTLGDELSGVELRNDSLEDFVTNGRQNTFVVVETEVLKHVNTVSCVRVSKTHLVNLRQLLDLWAVQHPQCEGDHLQVLGSGGGADVPRPCADIEDDGALQPGNQEMGALVDDLLLHSGQTVEDDGACATLDIVDGRLCDRKGDRAGDDPAEYRAREGGHGDVGGRMGCDVLGGEDVDVRGGK